MARRAGTQGETSARSGSSGVQALNSKLDHLANAGWDEPGAVRAAGGLVLRPRIDGSPELAVVHRPRYDDWSLPKGKLEHAAEGAEAAALREVREETGLRCEITGEVGSTRYRDQRGREKVVRYFAMVRLQGDFVPNAEVDQLLWLTPNEALSRLSHDQDRGLVRAWEEGRSRFADRDGNP